jgi:hypothetical protein
MKIPYIMGRDSITVMCEGVTHTVQKDHVNYVALQAAIREQRWVDVPDLVTPVKAVQNFVDATQGEIQIQDGEVLHQGVPVHNSVADRILTMVRDGFDAQPLMRFLAKLLSNPSKTAVTELYDWLAGTSLPITEDGDFIAYKKVSDNYYDLYSGQVLNKPAALMPESELCEFPKVMKDVRVEIVNGETVLHMPRNQVDDCRDRTCSQGLHFCSLSYLPSYHGGRGRVLLVRINPADVVSIPSDYNFAKGRAWRYTILREHDAGETSEAFDTPVVTMHGTQNENHVAAKTQTEYTLVMGMDFGAQARADQVRALVDDVIDRVQEARLAMADPEHARMKGFDDAWDAKMPDLSGYTGVSVRGALEYARAYYEGYDRCRGNSGVTPPATCVAPVVKPPVRTTTCNPALMGYNQGRKHGARGESFNVANSGFVDADQDRYVAAYTKGYNSVK